jgi:hypothetical protein
MSNVSIIIRREFNERVRKKSFIVSTLLMPLLMLALMAAPALVMQFSRGGEKTVAVIDESGLIAPRLESSEEIRFETMWAFQAPTVEEAVALVPATGWEKSPAKMARWAERDGRLVVTLDLAQIIAASVGPDADAEALTQVVMQVLDSDAATIKGLIASLLGVESIAISDETIEQLVGWVKNGIPLRVKEEDGHTRFYLGKEEFATLFKLRTYDDGAQSSDIANLLTLLGDAGMLPPEASMAGMLTNVISTGWDATESFEMGLDLVSE